MGTRARMQETQAARVVPGDIKPWPWSDPWNGHAMTPERARLEAFYAYRMHDAAMRRRLREFMTEGELK